MSERQSLLVSHLAVEGSPVVPASQFPFLWPQALGRGRPRAAPRPAGTALRGGGRAWAAGGSGVI